MELDLKLIDNIAIGVCRRTESFDILDDMKSEITLALLEGKIENTIKSLTSFTWAYYRKEINNKRVFIDLDIGVYGYKTNYNDSFNIRRRYYNLKYVEPVYTLHATGKSYAEIGKILGIHRNYANQQVSHTLHLPIVSTFLKNQVIKVSQENLEKSWVDFKEKYSKPFLKGNKNPSAKLNNQKVLEMRKLYKIDGISIGKIAKMPEFNVSGPTAFYAIIGKTWKNI